MAKLQILNENQVKHFTSYIFPKLTAEFNSIVEVLEEELESIKNNITSHELITKEEEKVAKKLETIEQLSEIQKALQKISSRYSIKDIGYGMDTDIISTAIKYSENPEKVITEVKRVSAINIDDIKTAIARDILNINNLYSKRARLLEELKARLSMTEVADADTIEFLMLTNIDVESFFINI